MRGTTMTTSHGEESFAAGVLPLRQRDLGVLRVAHRNVLADDFTAGDPERTARAAPLARSEDVDQPPHAELVDEHAERVTPRRLFQRGLDGCPDAQ